MKKLLLLLLIFISFDSISQIHQQKNSLGFKEIRYRSQIIDNRVYLTWEIFPECDRIIILSRSYDGTNYEEIDYSFIKCTAIPISCYHVDTINDLTIQKIYYRLSIHGDAIDCENREELYPPIFIANKHNNILRGTISQ